MAHNVDAHTNEGVGEDKELDNWLTKHDLLKIKHILQKENISLKDLTELSQETDQELKEYGKNELHLDLMSRKRFVRAVKSLATQLTPPKPVQKQQKIVRIVMSTEEDEAIGNIGHKKEEINKYMQNMINDRNTLKQIAQSNENELTKIEQQLFKKITVRINELKSKSNQEINQKSNVLSSHIKKLTQYMKRLNDAQKQADDFLYDANMDKKKRKIKIVNISKTVLAAKITMPNITPTVKIEMNTNAVLDYIANIGKVQSFTFPDTPLISVTDIQSNSVTVIFNNKKPSYEYKIELCENYESEEKKVNWKDAILQRSKENKYIILDLSDETKYAIRSKYKNKFGFGKYSNIATFKTKQFVVGISSKILGPIDKLTLYTLFKNNGKKFGKSWNLLYRRTRDGTDMNVFKNRCHCKQNIICLIRTNTNNIFGGYTASGWKNNNRYTRDEKAFIFSVKSSANYKPAIFNVTIANNATICRTNGYCAFGGGAEFYIQPNGNGHAYKQPQQYEKYPNDHYLTNAPNSQFTVSEVEIFQMTN